jgi:hypothetical protein
MSFPICPLFAFGPFGSGLMLLWAAAAAIPVLIHLWSKRRYRETTWAAMEFLLRAVKKNARRIHLEQLILLAMRVSILVLLALALAEPGCSTAPLIGGSLAGGGQSHTVLVLDGSYSMEYRRQDRTRFETAKKMAIEVVENSRQGDGFTLVLMADAPRVIIAEPAFDPQDVIEEINGLETLHGGANLPATLAEVEKILDTAGRDYPRLTQNKVCFFSDLQEATWEAAAGDDFRSRIGGLADRAALALIDLGEPGPENLAVTRLETLEPLATIAREMPFLAEVRNFGGQSIAGRRVEFLVDGQRVGEMKVDVESGGAATVAFSHPFETPGEHSVEVRLGDDPLLVDNHRWLSVPVRESIRVLCVRGKQGAAEHLAYALSPTQSASQSAAPRVKPEVVVESLLLELDLSSYDAIFLSNVGRFGRDEANILYQYVAGGGGLVTFLGDQVQPESYNQTLGGGEDPALRVLPAQLGEPVFDLAGFAIDPLEYQHPIVKPFEGQPRAGLLTTPVWKYIRLAPYDAQKAKIAAALGAGDPLIVEESVGRGRSILVATAAGNDSVHRGAEGTIPWTSLPLWPSFPPLVQEMLSLAVSGRSESRNVAVGDELTAPLPRGVSAQAVTITGPNNRRERISSSMQGDDRRWTYSGLDLSGLYHATYDSANVEQIFAANLDPRESELTRIDPDTLPGQFSKSLETIADKAPAVALARPRQELFRLFLGALVLLLFGEMFAAWWFGGRRA